MPKRKRMSLLGSALEPITNVLITPNYKKVTPGKFGGGTFGGNGSGGSFNIGDTTFPFARTFNQAYDNAVDLGLDEFTFNNKKYNTDIENNPIRERNNRIAGNLRVNGLTPDSVYDHIPYVIGNLQDNTPIITKRQRRRLESAGNTSR